MSTTIANAVRSAAADAVVDSIDGGAAAGYVEIRTGTQPAGPDTAATGTLLVTITLNDPAFGAAATGVATADTTGGLTGTAVATGTAGYFRVYDSNGVALIDGACGTSGSDMNLSSTSISSGQDVSITSWTVTMPGS